MRLIDFDEHRAVSTREKIQSEYFDSLSRLKIRSYTEGYGPPSYAEAIVCCLAQRWDSPTFRAPARCAKRSLYTEGFGPPSYAPHSVLSGAKGGEPPFRALRLV